MPERREASAVEPEAVQIGGGPVTLAEILAVAERGAPVRLSEAPAFRDRLQRSRAALAAALEHREPVYGVTTGFGEACGRRLQAAETAELGRNLIRYHGCGAGEPLGLAETRAAVLCRLIGLARGYSAVGDGLLVALAELLNRDVVPVIPAQGSVGASGDLTPLSYLAACLAGEREAFHRGRRMPAAEALSAAGLAPYDFAPKEPLALINGTSVMTGIAAVAAGRARRVLNAVVAASALSVHALAGHPRHFDEALLVAKPHAGSARVAARLRALLAATAPVAESDEPRWLQDPYSLRCSPQVLGVLADALGWIEGWVTTEANSANDNPLLDPDSGRVHTGGNFYGGHIAFAMDALKSAVASAADLADRQVALLVDERFSRGLPAGLVPAERGPLHHGLKGLQITASALTAEALGLTMPAASFSRSTESHNQDKVSMGTIAARGALQVVELAASVAAVHLLAAAQGAELRGDLAARPALGPLLAAVRRRSARLSEDRELDGELAALTRAVLAGELTGGDQD